MSERTAKKKPEPTSTKKSEQKVGRPVDDRLVDENGKKITYGEALKRGIVTAVDRDRPDPTGLKAANVPTSGRPTARGVQSVMRGGLPGHGKNR